MAGNFIPDGQFVPDPAPAAAAQGAPDFIPDEHFEADEDRYGGLGQEALTALEGAAQGFAGPVATATEKGLSSLGVPGLSPQEQAGRKAANPIIHGASDAAGLGAGILTGTGEARAMELAGEGALHLAGLSGELGTAAKIGAGALKGAVENATFQAGDEISQRINDPSLGASSAIAHIGLSGLIGAAPGGVLGAISPLWTKANAEAVEQGIQDFNNATEGSVVDQDAIQPLKDIQDAGQSAALGQPKQNAAEIIDAATRNDWPVLEGMVSGSSLIQKGEDALLNGPPTVASIARQRAYQSARDAVTTAVDHATSAPPEALTETQAGNALKTSLTGKLEAENAPIKEMYQAIEPYQQAIPVSDRSTGALSRSINGIIEDRGLVPGSERYNFVKTFADGIDSVDNLQKLKNFRTEVARSTGPLTKDLAQDISERLDGVEQRAIRRYAETMKTDMAKDKILNVLDQMQDAKSAYRQFRSKLQTLGNSMGKKRIAGPQDFIDFVNEMNPQQLTRKLFNENNTEFANWFSKNFPEEFGIMRGYQRAQIRSSAMKDGLFTPHKAVKEILGMEPEARDLLFTPNEVQLLNDAKTYLDSFPKAFNPSGTSHMSAMREFFEHPTGAAISNLRDFGIQSFIKTFGRAVPGADAEAAKIIPLMGKSVGQKEIDAGGFKHALDYSMAAIRGVNATGRAAKSVLNASIPVAASKYADEDDLKRLDQKLQDFKVNPDLYSQVGGNLGHYLPNHDVALKSVAANAVGYLNSIRPATRKDSPLDPEIKPSPMAQAQFNRALAIAEKPLSIVSLMKDQKLTQDDVTHLKAMYPGVYQHLAQKLTEEVVNQVAAGKPVPYETRQALSRFLGQPLDSSMRTQNIQSNQAAFQMTSQKGPQPAGPAKAKPSVVGMRNLKSSDRLSLSPPSDED